MTNLTRTNWESSGYMPIFSFMAILVNIGDTDVLYLPVLLPLRPT
jgi:hypothetical protein